MHVTIHIHAQEHVPIQTHRGQPHVGMRKHFVGCMCFSMGHCIFFSKVCVHRRGETWFCLAPVCLYWYVFLCMYAHGHMRMRTMPAASFSCVFTVYPCLFVGVGVLSGACALLQGLGLGGCRLKHDSACLRGAGVTRVCMMGAGEHCWALS